MTAESASRYAIEAIRFHKQEPIEELTRFASQAVEDYKEKLSENDVIAGVERMLSESQNNVDSDQKKKGSENTPTPEEMADWDRPKSKPVPSEQEKQEEIQKEIFDVSLKYTRDPAFLGWLFNTFNFTRK